MTGRDLIVFIMENRVEDEVIFENGGIPGFMTIDQAAEKWNVWTATVKNICKTKNGSLFYYRKRRLYSV